MKHNYKQISNDFEFMTHSL